MHNLAYALLPIEEADSSQKAREVVYDYLINDPSFVDIGDLSYMYWSPRCDWFKIGGKWSGKLNSQNILDEFFRKAKDLQEGNSFEGYLRDFITKNQDTLEKIWDDLGGMYGNPLSRDVYGCYGYEDDARIMDEEIAEKIKMLGQSDISENGRLLDCSSDNCYWEINDAKELIGKAWVVVIDYHY